MSSSFMPVSSDRLVKLPEVEALSGLSKSSIYRRVQDKTFPAPVKLGPRSIGWRLSSIESWIAGRNSQVDVQALIL